jgi:hypothetical protein
MHRTLARLAVILALFIFTIASGQRAAYAAEPLDPKAVPEPLKPWVGWALDGKDDALCPTFHAHAELSRCAWPARLELALDEHGGRFNQTWHLDSKRWVPLPGDEKRWPTDVKVDGARAVIALHEGAPSLQLDRGDHAIAGAFAWDSLPESLHVPPETGLLSLGLRGTRVASPNRDAQGTVWLQKAASNEEGDALELVVHRKITDDIPLYLTTRIELHVSGKSREELLGRALPAGFVPLSLDSVLPARLEPDGRLRVQVRPGVFTLELTARSEGLANTLKRPAPEGPWREGEEVWVFEAKNDYRVVTVEGVPSIDPQQTTLPDAWKRLPAYPMKLGDTLTLAEKRRGDADPPPNQLSLVRSLWLDFNGSGYTASDTLTGTLERDSRLTMAPPTVLGRVSIGGKDQFITHLGDAARMGVEVRQGRLTVSADSRIPGDPTDIPAVSWAHDFHQVSGSLHLPPGWRLFHASGVDEVPSTWVRHWSLLELFLALIVAIGIGRLHGPRWGAVALVTLALTFPEDGAPKWLWLFVLASEALFRVVPVGKIKKVLGGVRVAAVVGVALFALPFSVQQVRESLYPALADADANVGAGGRYGEESNNMEGGTGTRARGEMGGMAKAKEVDAPAPIAVESEKSVAADKLDVARDEDGANQPKAPPAGKGWDARVAKNSYQSNAQVYDPASVVQTGPGLPRWQWTTLDLRWSGPVAATQRLHLYLLSPRVNLLLAFARVLLLALLVLRLFPWTQRVFPRGWGPVAAASAAILLLLAPAPVRAQVPDKATLTELQERLLRKPECSPSCASSGRMAIEVRAGTLRARLEVDAIAATAVPLPGTSAQWTPTEVLLDGKPAKGLVRMSDGVLWIELAAGSHQIVLEGPMPDRESVQLALHLKPHRVEATSEGWTVAGVHEDGLADDNVQLTRIRAQDGGAGAALQPGALPPFVRVERTLQVGLNWQVDTRVVRVSPPGAAVVLEIPLLPGESVTTADVRVVGGKALVNMGPQAMESSWHSVLEQKSPVRLVAPKSIAWVEVWHIDVGPIWHASYTGIPFVHTQPVGDLRVPEWRPWPGEEASVVLVRPDGVPGQTLTIDQSTTDIRPGLRATDVTLTLSLRSSRGAQHTVTLPPDAQLESLSINGVTQPIRQEGRRVTVPIVPGLQSIVLVWRETPGLSPFFTAPEIDLGAPSVNATTTLQVPGGRWLLFVGGPRVGPAVLFWSLLLVLIVVSVALGENRWTPLRSWHWLLLAIGLSQVSVVAGAVFVGWLLALGWRARRVEGLGVVAFNLRQLAIVLWTVVAFVILGVSVYQGLLGAPEMQVRGNGSNADMLRWFTDRTEATLPAPWMLSVPILVYRAAMLGWALWIALAVLKWLRWGWTSFTSGGGWKKSPPRPRPVMNVPVPGPYYPGGYPQQAPGYPQPPQAQQPQPPQPQQPQAAPQEQLIAGKGEGEAPKDPP